MSRNNSTPLVIGALLASSLGVGGSAFAMQPLAQGYILGATSSDKVAAADDPSKGGAPASAKASEGCCGTAQKIAEGKCGEGQCGGAKCGDPEPAAKGKATGEGKCGEGKCGEGKCGSA